MCTNKFFKTSRESIGLEPFITKKGLNNFNDLIKNNSFKIKECQKFLNLTEEQIKNAIRLDILKSKEINDVIYICIESAIKVKDNYTLLEQIFNEDELCINLVADILDLTIKNVKRLIDEGYLTIINDKDYKSSSKLVKRGEIKKLIPQINEIKNFWKTQAKINRQMGAKKTLEIRKNKVEYKSNFKDNFLRDIENLPYKESRLIKASLYIIVLNYYISRKLNKNIIDDDLITLKSKSYKKLLEVYEETSFIKTKYVQGFDIYINYCSNCIKNNLNNNNCYNCKFDEDYFSVVITNIFIKDYDFNIYIAYKDIRDWFDRNKYPCEIPLNITYFKEDHFFINNEYISINELKNFKIFEVINYLKEFIDSKDFDLSINL